MTVTYTFASLADMADHFDRIAKARREEASGSNVRQRHRTELLAEAAAFDQAASTIRRSSIEEARR